MNAASDIRIRTWVAGTEADVRSGLLGFVSLEFGPLILDSLTVRRTASGRIALSFPERQDRTGRRHAIYRPLDDDARVAIEHAVLGELARQQEVTP